ncbi:hypothetical protein SOP56_02525 [Weissella confusa]|uniref:hypothetical protein n=1 Tax=Weissella confusa TaxID=1583 RepID=UPI002A751A0C|nr:hypothetical protein [Weissella confusa]MDY2528732.1 hypothetical protein [Weissella confusa]
MQRYEFENGPIIEVTNDGMNIKGNNTTIAGETTASIENRKLSKEIHDYVDNQVRYLEGTDEYVEHNINILSNDIKMLNKKISDLNYEKLETWSELEVLKACFWSFVIFLVVLAFMLLIYPS